MSRIFILKTLKEGLDVIFNVPYVTLKKEAYGRETKMDNADLQTAKSQNICCQGGFVEKA